MAEIVVAAGGILGPSIRILMELVSNIANSFASGGLRTKVDELATHLDVIRGMVDQVGKEAFVGDAPVVAHLWRLKDAIQDTSEILNMLRQEASQQQGHGQRAVDIIARLVVGDGGGGGSSSNNNNNNKSLDELSGRIERLDKDYQRLQDLIQASPHGARGLLRQTTGPMPRRGKLFGYEREYAELLRTLRYGDAGVVAIIGHAGMGKTELVRQAYHNQKIVKARFDLRIWVCVYGKFSETQLLKEIWRSAFGRDPSGDMNVTSLQQDLTKKVGSAFGRRRYLLVLDDVCNDESAANDLSRRRTWDTVLAPFKQHGKQGSRIIVTTRAQICSETLRAGARIQLNGISNAAMELLLKETAFEDQHAQVLRELQDVLDVNVGKLHGSPFAAEEVGSMLKANHDSRWWKESLNKDHHVGVYRNHLSSYQDLPLHLQRCFAFCSIFPKEWRFEPEKLIMMWMALGFVESPPGSNSGGMTREEEENVARSYFDALLQRSLFQEAAVVNVNSEASYYVIHEHIHSMIRRVCPAYFQSIDGSSDLKAPVTLTTDHLSITSSRLRQVEKAQPSELKKLRTLLVFNDNPRSASDSSDVKLLRKCKGVRVLDISETCIDAMPGIGKMKHLRYLGLPNTIHNLGARFGRLTLLHLQTLYLKSDANMAGIGSLEKLHGSVEFHAGRKKGRDIGQLEKLNFLRQILSITGLETVPGMEEATSAQLDKKEYLKVLKLEWGNRDQKPAQVSDSNVLEGLQPHPNLEKLHIIGYLWTTLPEWLKDPSGLQNLRSLYLSNCRELKDLPLVGELPHLELLNIKNLCSVKTISHTFCTTGAFESLETLVLEGMPGLVSWDAEPIICTPTLFPKLREVHIINCPRLSSLTGLLYCRNSLIYLQVERCQGVTTTLSRSSFPFLTTELYITGCPGLMFKESPPLGAVLTMSLHLILVLFAIFIYHKMYYP